MFLGTGDGWSARMLPISILQEGDLDLDEFMDKDSMGDFNVFIPIRGDHFVSKFPVLSSILALPVYAIPYLLNLQFNTSLVLELAKTSAALITVLSAVFMYLIFRKYVSEKWSLVLTLLYAFGTSSWTISAQDLWQHGTEQLFLAMTIYFALQKVKTKQNMFIVGLCAGLTIAARYLGVILIVPVAIYFLHKHRKYFLYFVSGITIPIALLALYNTYYFGLPWV
ncbi:MAG: glycosyltransferase family 39 protein, partial [Patescibacteria group bacterium]